MPRSGPGGPIGRPLRRKSPPLAGSKPPRMCRNVLLPQPEGPTMETNSCSSMESDKRSIAVTLRLSTVNVLSRSVTSSSGIVTGLVHSGEPACAQRATASRVDPAVGAEPSILRYFKYDAVGILEFAFEISETIVAEIEKECSSGGLDFLLRFRQIVNLEAEVIGSNC